MLSAQATPTHTYLAFKNQMGQGLPQDYAEAARLYRLAADQGHAEAKSNLAGKYLTGDGVWQDLITAHMWTNIAGTNGETCG